MASNRSTLIYRGDMRTLHMVLERTGSNLI
jgi:hypothetical protein